MRLYTVSPFSPALKARIRDIATQHDADLWWRPMAQVSNWRMTRGGRFDTIRLAGMIWTPDRDGDVPLGWGDETRYGVRPGSVDEVQLDFEAWDFGNPDTVFDHIQSAAALRALRPHAKIVRYWKPKYKADEQTPQRQIIASTTDAISLPLYLDKKWKEDPDWAINKLVVMVREGIRLADKSGIPCYAELWKRHNDRRAGEDAGRQTLIPDEMQVMLLDAVLFFDFFDGVILFDTDSVVMSKPDNSPDKRFFTENPTQEESEDSTAAFVRRIVERI